MGLCQVRIICIHVRSLSCMFACARWLQPSHARYFAGRLDLLLPSCSMEPDTGRHTFAGVCFPFCFVHPHCILDRHSPPGAAARQLAGARPRLQLICHLCMHDFESLQYPHHVSFLHPQVDPEPIPKGMPWVRPVPFAPPKAKA